jgi:zinc protease
MTAFRLRFVLLLVFVSSAALGDDVTLPAVERVVLENGTVVLLNENHDVPLIGLEAVVRGGAAADPAGKHGLASLLANLLVKGANERSSSVFAEAVASVGGRLDASASLESRYG